MRQFAFVVLFGVLLVAPFAFAAQSPSAHGFTMIRVLLLDGQSAGSYHNWRLTTPVLKAELAETGLFQVTVITAPQSDPSRKVERACSASCFSCSRASPRLASRTGTCGFDLRASDHSSSAESVNPREKSNVPSRYCAVAS